MKQVESDIAEFVIAAADERTAKGRVQCHASPEHVGLGSSSEHPGDDQELYRALSGNRDFLRLLRRSWEESQNCELGPWYSSIIELQNSREVTFTYFWEQTPFNSVKELRTNSHGGLPLFAFKKRFDRALIDELSDDEADVALCVHVVAAIQSGVPVAEALKELWATAEWQCDVERSEFNHYFARMHDPAAIRIPSVEFHSLALRGLKRLGHTEAESLYSEAIALYAHFHPHVEQTRVALGLPQIPRTEYSDIMDRYWDIRDSIEPARVQYLRRYFEECIQG